MDIAVWCSKCPKTEMQPLAAASSALMVAYCCPRCRRTASFFRDEFKAPRVLLGRRKGKRPGIAAEASGSLEVPHCRIIANAPSKD